jgi:hypothetical protein
MRNLNLSQVGHSLCFWPAVILSVIAVFFFGWAVVISSQDWAGQVMWGAVASVAAILLLFSAIRESHRMGAQHRRPTTPAITAP